MDGTVSGVVVLKRDRAKPVVQHHPWIFSGSIDHVEGAPAGGEIVDVRDTGNNWLARGYLNTVSQIAVRLLTWDREETIDRVFWRRRLAQALAARHLLAGDPRTSAYRLVHAESDFLPGLVVDRYGDWLVVQFLTLGVECWRSEIVSALVGLTTTRGVYERSDVEVREKEGLTERKGLVWGEDPPPHVEIRENGHSFLVDIREGQKTGFYLDQRENRARLVPFCAGAVVLDAFAYTGACAIYAAVGAAERLTLVDSSAPALELARHNLMLNGIRETGLDCVEGNVFSVLRGYREEGRAFNVIVVDPPKLAATGRDVQRAARAYKDVNLLAFQLLQPGGILFTTSCSGAISADLFQKIVFGAALDAGREAQILGYLAQGADHPVALTFPEGAYLKGLICRTP
jgi:23S rRNA (cytosine1962-C5)-methyltransferase